MRDEWIETSLGEIAEVVGGGTPSTTIGEHWDGDIVWLTPTEITSQDGKVVSNSIRKITDLGFKNSGAQMLPIDSVILTSRASVGFVALAGRDLCTNQGFQSLIPKPSVLSKFLMFWIQQNRPEFESRSAGSTFKEISKSNVKSIKLQLPPLREQKRIVDLISSVDAYNQALQQQLESAKRSRNAVLHELMTQALDENRKPLIELAKLQRGHDLPTQDRIEGSIPVVASNGVVGFHNTHKAIGPGVVTGRSGTIGKVIYIDDDYWPLNTTLYVIDFRGNLPKFVALVLETLKLENYAGGSTVPSLDRKVLSQVPVPYPSIKEQDRIVGIIQSLDEVVAKSELAISQAKILRTGLLSDLLSGTHEIPASYDKIMGAA
jgi:type I restriction enzyme, S subunit